MNSLTPIWHLPENILSTLGKLNLKQVLSLELVYKIQSFVKRHLPIQNILIDQTPQCGALDMTFIDQDSELITDNEYLSLIKLLPPAPTKLSNAKTLEEYRLEFLKLSPVPAVIHLQDPLEEKKALKQIDRDIQFGQTSLILDNEKIHTKEEAKAKAEELPERKYVQFLSELGQGIGWYLSEYVKNTFENQNLNIFCSHTAQEHPLNISADTQFLTIKAEKSCELFYVDGKGNKSPVFPKGDLEHEGYLKPFFLKGTIEIDFSLNDIQAIVFVEKVK